MADALDGIPPALGAQMDNVAVVVEEEAEDGALFGLYEGIPLTQRDQGGYSWVMPDRITVYRRTICEACRSEAEVVDQVRTTVVHEVAHHFGIDDRRLEELGWA